MSDISVCDNEVMGETSTPTAKKTRKSSKVFGLGSISVRMMNKLLDHICQRAYRCCVV